MDPPKEVFAVGQAIRWIETQNTIALVRPVTGSTSRRAPGPTAGLAHLLRFRQVSLTAPEGLLGPLLFAQIEYESDPIVPTSFEECAAQQHRHAAAVFPEELLLESLKDPGRLQISCCPFVAVAPFGGREVCPAHTTGSD